MRHRPRTPPAVLDVRSVMYRNLPFGVRWTSAAQMSLSVLRGGGPPGAPTAPRGAPGPSLESAGSPEAALTSVSRPVPASRENVVTVAEQLAERVEKLVVVGQDEVARAGRRLHQRHRGGVRGQPSRLGVEGELEDLVRAQRGDEDEPVAPIGADRVRVAPHRDHLQRLGRDPPVGPDRVDADQVGAIRRAEQESGRSGRARCTGSSPPGATPNAASGPRCRRRCRRRAPSRAWSAPRRRGTGDRG